MDSQIRVFKDFETTRDWTKIITRFITQPNGSLQMAVAVDITSTTNDCVPSYIHARSDRRLYWLPAKRPVVGRWPIMKPFIESWERAERVATQALLCQSRGSESSELCSHCKGGGGVFDKCVALRNEYNNRCANCVFSQRRDCELATRYNVEPDYDYVPRQQLTQGGGDQTRASSRQLRRRGQREQRAEGQQRGQTEQRGRRAEGQQRGQRGHRSRGPEQRSRRPGPRRPGRREQRPTPRPQGSRERRAILALQGTAERPIELELLENST